MFKSRLAIAFGVLAVGTVGAQAAWFSDEGTFVSNLQGAFYLEDFSNFTFGDPLDGTQTTWSAPGANGYGWDAFAANGLWSNESALSTNTAADSIVITFTGSPVTAFGGLFANSDISGNLIEGTVTVLLSNGDTQSANVAAGSEAFIGWTGNTAITSVTLSSTGPAANNWIQGDHIYTGSAVPEPATMAVLGVGALALLRRRKKA